jgi:DDE superfamily endonuclease
MVFGPSPTPTTTDDDDDDDIIIQCYYAQAAAYVLSSMTTGKRLGSLNVRRQRIPVQVIFSRLGPRLFSKAYRMSEQLWWKLHGTLLPLAVASNCRRKRGSTPNGDIPFSSRLSMAIRYFAGGEPIDILQVHGVGYQQVYISVWIVVDAINQCDSIKIGFPTDHSEQLRIARGFQQKSKVGFQTCVGCIDAMLVWMNKPCQRSKAELGIGPKKFYCGRKKKFGISFQAICDDRRRFMDIDVRHPGSTSDYLCFTTSSIHKKLLANEDFLHPTLHFFGDSAYVNTPFMATPFKGTQAGVNDAYNFYHSQLRINIECAFGMLVHRWGILRKPIPVNITVTKTTHLVRALCILHNFCIDGKEKNPEVSATDRFTGLTAGGFIEGDPQSRPTELIDHGHHADDYNSRTVRRQEAAQTDLPRDRLVEHLRERHIDSRPAPRGSTSTNNN